MVDESREIPFPSGIQYLHHNSILTNILANILTSILTSIRSWNTKQVIQSSIWGSIQVRRFLCSAPAGVPSWCPDLVSLEGHEVVMSSLLLAVLNLPLLKVSSSADLTTVLHHKRPPKTIIHQRLEIDH